MACQWIRSWVTAGLVLVTYLCQQLRLLHVVAVVAVWKVEWSLVRYLGADSCMSMDCDTFRAVSSTCTLLCCCHQTGMRELVRHEVTGCVFALWSVVRACVLCSR